MTKPRCTQPVGALIALAVVIIFAIVITACTNDNTEIRANADDTFRYTHWTQESQKGRDSAELHFINESTHETMTWKGDVRDAMVYLEQIDKGKCYKNPVDRDQAVEVPCD